MRESYVTSGIKNIIYVREKEKQQEKMTRKTDKPTGRGVMRGQVSAWRQPGGGDRSPRRQKELQGRGGRGGRGTGTPPRTTRQSTRLGNEATKKQEELRIEEDEKANNPFLILRMDEDEESVDEELEDSVDKMQVVSPQRSPR